MKKFLTHVLSQKKTILILGIMVSVLVLLQNDIYSNAAIKKIEPKYRAFKTRLDEHIATHSSNQDNLKNANFIATFFSTLSQNSTEEKMEQSFHTCSLQQLKTKIHEFVASF